MDTMQTAIIEKLQKFLQSHSRFREECEVVYLMVEIKKILECENSNSYKILRFYRNWAVHNKLNQSTDPLLRRFKNIDFTKSGHEIAREMNSKHADFFKLNDFKNELKGFLENYNLPLDLVNKYWVSFIKTLLKVIEERPLVFSNSSKTIKCLRLVKDSRGNPCYRFDLVNNRMKPKIKLKFR